MQSIYLVLAILGFILPYSQLVPFFVSHGLDWPLFWSELFANQISTDFACDLLTSSVVFWFYLWTEGSRLKIKLRWLYVALNLLVGLSFALPLFLWARSRAIDNSGHLERV